MFHCSLLRHKFPLFWRGRLRQLSRRRSWLSRRRLHPYLTRTVRSSVIVVEVPLRLLAVLIVDASHQRNLPDNVLPAEGPLVSVQSSHNELFRHVTLVAVEFGVSLLVKLVRLALLAAAQSERRDLLGFHGGADGHEVNFGEALAVGFVQRWQPGGSVEMDLWRELSVVDCGGGMIWLGEGGFWGFRKFVIQIFFGWNKFWKLTVSLALQVVQIEQEQRDPLHGLRADDELCGKLSPLISRAFSRKT